MKGEFPIGSLPPQLAHVQRGLNRIVVSASEVTAADREPWQGEPRFDVVWVEAAWKWIPRWIVEAWV